MVIRNENASDIDAIAEVTEVAFRTLAISNHTEQFITNALRAAGVLTVSLVAVIAQLLPAVRVPQLSGVGSRGRAARGFACLAVYRSHPPGCRQFPRSIPGDRMTSRPI